MSEQNKCEFCNGHKRVMVGEVYGTPVFADCSCKPDRRKDSVQSLSFELYGLPDPDDRTVPR